jgi:hypothetical protein
MRGQTLPSTQENVPVVASSKRRMNKKLYARQRKQRAAGRKRNRGSRSPPSPPGAPAGVVRGIPVSPPPSELDQVKAFIAEPELGRAETTLSELRDLARELPFEPTMFQVSRLNLRLESVLTDPVGQWQLAQGFYAGDDVLLEAYAGVLKESPDRFVFSPQPLALLMRILIDEARDEPLRDLTATEQRALQRAVLGAHSALETALDAMAWPTGDHVLAYELQAATYFRRPSLLEEMARHDELLRLAADDPRLLGSRNRVPVRDWLASYGLTADEQWSVGFGLAAMTRAFGEQTRPRTLAAHVDDLLAKLKLPDVSRELPVIAANRADLQAAFGALGGGDATVAWELRPFKLRPFLRLGDGDLLLLALPWLLSWLGEGFHYRAIGACQAG